MTASPEVVERRPHKHCPQCGDELDGEGPVCTSCKVREYDETTHALRDYHPAEPEIDHDAEHAAEHRAEPT